MTSEQSNGTLGANVPRERQRVRNSLRRALFGFEAGSHLSDISEFQAGINWGAYGPARHAVVVRAHNGWRQDYVWSSHRDGARSSCQVRGWYQYLVPGKDVVGQANQFCDTVGALQPGEFVVLDLEDPGFGGNQQGAALAWFGVVRFRLHTTPNQEWFYSYWPYVQEHFGGGLGWLGGRPAWIAGYSFGAPSWRSQVQLWQHTDGQYGYTGCQPAPGIGSDDCSVYAGSIDQLGAFVGGTPPPVPKFHPSGGQEERSNVAIATRPQPGNRAIDAAVIGADGNVYGTWATTPEGLATAVWENLGSPYGAKSVSLAWTQDGGQLILTCHGTDNAMWLKVYDSTYGWLDNGQWKRSGAVLAP